MTCRYCGEPIAPVTIAGVTAWHHTGRNADWDSQGCTGIRPRVRAMPEDAP